MRERVVSIRLRRLTLNPDADWFADVKIGSVNGTGSAKCAVDAVKQASTKIEKNSVSAAKTCII